MEFSIKRIILFLIIITFIFIFGADWFIFGVPSNFSIGRSFTVEEESSLSQIANQLEGQGFIRSSIVFVFLSKMTGLEKKIRAGEYWFQIPLSTLEIIRRFARADFGLSPVKITIPEGSSVEDVAEILVGFNNFDKEEFLKKGKDAEGYLFPDTYFFMPNITSEKLIETMRDNFNKKIKEIDGEIKESPRSLSEIIIMASLVEKEIANPKDRKIVSGILWKRLDNRMPLQVDAVFPYIIGKNSFELTLDDLKFDSPYNTYLYKGLPPAPICNPGIEAILVAANPEPSLYWYYLSDKNGDTYFAETFEKHRLNKAKYLR